MLYLQFNTNNHINNNKVKIAHNHLSQMVSIETSPSKSSLNPPGHSQSLSLSPMDKDQDQGNILKMISLYSLQITLGHAFTSTN